MKAAFPLSLLSISFSRTQIKRLIPDPERDKNQENVISFSYYECFWGDVYMARNW